MRAVTRRCHLGSASFFGFSFHSKKAMNPNRRNVLRAGLAGLVATLPACATRSAGSAPLLGFSAIPVSSADNVVVPPGYRTQVLFAWGDPIGQQADKNRFGSMPATAPTNRRCTPACT